MEKETLKMSLQEIRDQIDIKKYEWNDWNSKYSTNCYAYALGLDIPQEEITDYAYDLGIISGYPDNLYKKTYFTYTEAINSLHSDLDALKIGYEECSPCDKLIGNGWRIAFFTKNAVDKGMLKDFHFMRQGLDGTWYHKCGYGSIITNKDGCYNVINDPTDCFVGDYEYRKSYNLYLKRR